MSKKPTKKKKTTAGSAENVKQAKVNTQKNPKSTFWKNHGIPALLLVILAMGLYASTINYEYVLDDAIVIEKNNQVKKGFAGIKEIMNTESFTGYFGEQKDLVLGARYRPLSLVTFAIECQLFGKKSTNSNIYIPNPKISHFINILLYGLTALVLFRLLLLWFPDKDNKEWYWSMAFLASLFFVTHPIHSEVVANVKGRDEIITVLFSLLALYASWKYFKRGSWAWLALGAGVFMLALLSKENALTMVAIVPLAGYFFRKTSMTRLATSTLVFAIVGLGYLVLRSDIIGYFLSSGKEITDVMNNPFFRLSAADKFATIFYTLGQYIKLLIFPHPLTHDYYPYHIPIMSWGDWKTLLAFAVNIGLLVLAIKGLFKKKIWAFGILFYFATLSIVSNIPFTVGTFMNERFVYLSSIGFAIVLAWLLVKFLPTRFPEKGKIAAYAIAGIFALGFIVKTLERTPVWESALTLNAAAIKISKNSARANLFYGTAVFEEYKVESDREKKYAMLDVVSKHVRKAVEINPQYYSAWTMVAGVAAEEHKKSRDLQKLLDDFYEVLAHRPNIPFIDEYLNYLKGTSNTNILIDFSIRSGKMLTQKGDLSNAMRMFNYGLTIEDSHPELRQSVGEMLQKAGNYEKAKEYLQ